jgi:hypothetical protein
MASLYRQIPATALAPEFARYGNFFFKKVDI